MKRRLGLVGLGLMGKPMARQWLQKGFPLHILPHMKREAAEELAGLGAQVAPNLERLAHESDVVILMVPTSREVEALTQSLIHLLKPEQLVIDMSTSDPLSTKKIHEEFLKKNLRFMDAPVTGGVKGAESGSLTLFVGGPRDWFDEAKPVLEAVSSVQGYFGPAGNGHVAKIINNILCIGNLAVFCEALPLAVRLGLDSKNIFETLMQGTGASEMLKIYGPQILAGDFQARFKLSHAYKDLKMAQDIVNHLQARLPVLQGMLEDFKKADEARLGDMNFSAIIKPVEDLLKAQFRN